jgi:hypothetical protein
VLEAKVARIIAENSAWDIKYIFYEAKVSQQTNLIFQAPFSRIKVRKPFVDYDLFDFFESLPNQTRSFLYPTMLKTKYGFLYKTIPNQKTGMPVMTPSWLINTERGRRLIYRNLQPLLKKMGFSSEPRVRNFLDDHYATSIDKSKAAIVEVLLGQSSLVCETLGKEKLSAFIESWFNSASVPSNALAALFAFEIFHKEVLKYRKS